MHRIISVEEIEPNGPIMCQVPDCGKVCEKDEDSYTIIHRKESYTLCEDCLSGALTEFIDNEQDDTAEATGPCGEEDQASEEFVDCHSTA